MLVLLASLVLAMAANKAPVPNPTSIRTMPVSPTPESSTVVLVIAIPRNGQVTSVPVSVQFRIDGFALGAASQFERAEEIVDTEMGQTVHVVIDNHPYFPINEPAIDPFDESGYYYNMSYKFQIPYRLGTGIHTIRMFPARSFGESLKGDQAFKAIDFYVGDRVGNPSMDLSGPYLTYNEPSNLMPLVENKPVLLDFYVSNAEISRDGYKVRLSIDGKFNRILTSWMPYYIYGLKKGRHHIRLELLDSANNLVPGEFNDASQTITIH